LSQQKNDFLNIVNKVRERGKVLIAAHHNPDGDAVGACFAMANFFAGLGVKPSIILEEYPSRYNFLERRNFFEPNETDGEILFCLDCGDLERLNHAADIFKKAGLTVNIDHHLSNSMFADINIVDVKAASVCEILYELINDAGFEVTKDIAEALYTGIVTDTNAFRNKNTTPRTLRVTACLHEKGIDFNMIQKTAVYYQHSMSEAKIFAAAVGGMRFIPDIKLNIAAVTNKQMEEAGAIPADLEGIAEYMLNIVGVETAVLLSERVPGSVNLSFRSLHLNVRDIAEKFGGGGHIHAAGGKVEGSLEKVCANVINMVSSMYTSRPE